MCCSCQRVHLYLLRCLRGVQFSRQRSATEHREEKHMGDVAISVQGRCALTHIFTLALACFSAGAAAQVQLAANLAELSLEELANLQVTSVSRRPERLADAAAALHVTPAEGIRHPGVTRLPAALRTAPDPEVGRNGSRPAALHA